MAKSKYDLAWCQNYAKSRGGQCLSDEFLGMQGRLTYRCAEGHVWEARPAKHAYEGSWCPECLSGVPHTTESISSLVAEKGFRLIGEFPGAQSKMTLQCSNGHEWLVTLVNFSRTKKGCPDCSQAANEYSRTKTRKYAISEIRDIATRRSGRCVSHADEPDNYMVTTAYRGEFECIYRHRWSTTYATVIRGHWCPHCAKGL